MHATHSFEFLSLSFLDDILFCSKYQIDMKEQQENTSTSLRQ